MTPTYTDPILRRANEPTSELVSWGHIWKLNSTRHQVLSPPIFVDDAGLILKAIAEWIGVTEWAASKKRQTAKALYTSNGDFRRTVDQIRVALI